MGHPKSSNFESVVEVGHPSSGKVPGFRWSGSHKDTTGITDAESAVLDSEVVSEIAC